LETAIRNAGLDALDDRGLMPMVEARALVMGAVEFRKGGGRMVEGQWVLDSDRLWGALLSLDSAAEFVREATRIQWFFHPRDPYNLSAYERYGNDIVPWLGSFLQPDGVLVNVPWCVVAHLLAVGTEEAFEIVWQVRAIDERVDPTAWPGPFAVDSPGDIDATEQTPEPVQAPEGYTREAMVLLLTWLDRHASLGFALLADKAHDGDERGAKVLKAMAQGNPGEIFDLVASARGETWTREVFAQIGAAAELDAAAILAQLDGAEQWPELCSSAGQPAYLGIRLSALRASGDDWAIMFERIEGSDAENLAVQLFAYGSRVAPGRVPNGHRSLGLSFERQADGEMRVVGPAGEVCLSASQIADQKLDASLACANSGSPPEATLAARAYLDAHPGAFWHDGQALREAAGMAEAELMVCCDSFEHVVRMAAPGERWRGKPSESAVFGSLAAALVARDASLFAPGRANLDWRAHCEPAGQDG